MWRNAPPHFSTDGTLRCPTLLGQSDEHARKAGIGAVVQSLNGPKRRAHEESFHYHLIPRVLCERFAGIWIAVRNGLEHRLHSGTNRFARPRFDQRSIRINGQAAAERDQLIDFGRGAKAVKPRREGSIVSCMACGHQRDAGQLIDTPIAGVKARTQRLRPRQFRLREREIGFTESPGRKTDHNTERSLVCGMSHVVDGPTKPRDAAIICLLRDPLVGECKKSIQYGGLAGVLVRAGGIRHGITTSQEWISAIAA